MNSNDIFFMKLPEEEENNGEIRHTFSRLPNPMIVYHKTYNRTQDQWHYGYLLNYTNGFRRCYSEGKVKNLVQPVYLGQINQ